MPIDSKYRNDNDNTLVLLVIQAREKPSVLYIVLDSPTENPSFDAGDFREGSSCYQEAETTERRLREELR